MEIQLENIGKKYSREWIFRGINYQFTVNKCYAVTGNNGSGKTTLLQIVAGIQPVSEGQLTYHFEGTQLPPDKIYQKLGMAGPYTSLIEEMTLRELLSFYQKFRSLLWKPSEVAKRIKLEKYLDRRVSTFSSGMKQKLKLALVFFSDCSIWLLDEPTTNLDETNINWYKKTFEQYSQNKLVLICSNQEHEYNFCSEVLNIQSFKGHTPY